jgi:hypothetical protein
MCLCDGAIPRMLTFGGWACAMPLHPNDDPSETALESKDPDVLSSDAYTPRLFRSRCKLGTVFADAVFDRHRMHAIPLSLQMLRQSVACAEA